MKNSEIICSINQNSIKNKLWREAIKLPIYSVAIMPSLIAASWSIYINQSLRLYQFLGFILASSFLLLWENLCNDLFDSETGVDKKNKPHSIVALIGNKQIISTIANISLIAGLFISILIAINSNFIVIILVILCCLLGYLYQGPPFRLGYRALGEPLCWITFGPLATTAALLSISNFQYTNLNLLFIDGLILGAGPALATTLVLFCSHFHQIDEDKLNGKISPLVILGTSRSSKLIYWMIVFIFLFEITPIIYYNWPFTSLMSIISLPSCLNLLKFVKSNHNKPNKIKGAKFLALKFQLINGLSLSVGLLLGNIFTNYS
tara:strand:+ start:18964 stop:19923 length:960 start_codon:yes stop_codon:yes gene_type:complete